MLEMLEIAIKFIAVLIALVGVILVYDARIITKKIFGFGDQNEASGGLKILGWILSIIGILIIFFAGK
jgi:hypothetical protein